MHRTRLRRREADATGSCAGVTGSRERVVAVRNDALWRYQLAVPGVRCVRNIRGARLLASRRGRVRNQWLAAPLGTRGAAAEVRCPDLDERADAHPCSLRGRAPPLS